MGTRISRREALKMGAATTIALTLAACSGGGSSGSNSNTLNMWVWSGAPLQQTAFKALTAAYPNDFKNVKLNVSTPSNGDQGVAQQLTLALAAHKNVPDFLMLNYTEVPQFAEKGVLEDISKIVSPVKNDLYTGVEGISAYNGTYFAFPWQIKSKLFYYRADLFEQAGIDVDAITTADDFIAAGRKFHEKFPKQYIINIGTQPAGYLHHETLSAFPNASFADRSGTYNLTTNPAFATSLNFIKQLHDSGIAYPIDDFTADWPAAIKNGSICGFLIANWMKNFLPGYATVAQTGKWKAKNWPTLFSEADQRYGSDAGGSVFVVPTTAPNKSLALEYLTRMRLDKQGALAVFNAIGNPPIMKSTQADVLDAIENTKKSDSISQDQWQNLPQNFFGKDYFPTEFASYNFTKSFGYDPSAIKQFAIYQQWANKAVQGKVSVNDALAGAQRDMQSQIGNPYKQ
ncbi:MAG: extracellular solute-binding protein [Ktedonobacteraceae bacterium]|nr:extracellular solute-binding protein [Ktedonobacteraceae bacterium]